MNGGHGAMGEDKGFESKGGLRDLRLFSLIQPRSSLHASDLTIVTGSFRYVMFISHK